MRLRWPWKKDPITLVDHLMSPVDAHPPLWSIIDGETWLTWLHVCIRCYEVRLTQVMPDNERVRVTIINRGDPEKAEVYCIVRGKEENDAESIDSGGGG